MRILLCLAATVLIVPSAWASESRQAILDGFARQAAAESPGFAGFSAERGRSVFVTEFRGGKDDTPACTSCHGSSPTATGHTRAGKDIEPMAVSKTPARFTDPEKVAKWFERNCNGVLGRACTATEKGDFITFMMGQ